MWAGKTIPESLKIPGLFFLGRLALIVMHLSRLANSGTIPAVN
jgi:hypothetical protein